MKNVSKILKISLEIILRHNKPKKKLLELVKPSLVITNRFSARENVQNIYENYEKNPETF
jgi:hypothetical protein